MIRLILLSLFTPIFLFAQSTVEMADSFRVDGKIYVVVAVVAVILLGIFFYLFRTESKLDKIEKSLGK